jgi:hypothetical protein
VAPKLVYEYVVASIDVKEQKLKVYLDRKLTQVEVPSKGVEKGRRCYILSDEHNKGMKPSERREYETGLR